MGKKNVGNKTPKTKKEIPTEQKAKRTETKGCIILDFSGVKLTKKDQEWVYGTGSRHDD